jgi:hypothetical protein
VEGLSELCLWRWLGKKAAGGEVVWRKSGEAVVDGRNIKEPKTVS